MDSFNTSKKLIPVLKQSKDGLEILKNGQFKKMENMKIFDSESSGQHQQNKFKRSLTGNDSTMNNTSTRIGKTSFIKDRNIRSKSRTRLAHKHLPIKPSHKEMNKNPFYEYDVNDKFRSSPRRNNNRFGQSGNYLDPNVQVLINNKMNNNRQYVFRESSPNNYSKMSRDISVSSRRDKSILSKSQKKALNQEEMEEIFQNFEREEHNKTNITINRSGMQDLIKNKRIHGLSNYSNMSMIRKQLDQTKIQGVSKLDIGTFHLKPLNYLTKKNQIIKKQNIIPKNNLRTLRADTPDSNSVDINDFDSFDEENEKNEQLAAHFQYLNKSPNKKSFSTQQKPEIYSSSKNWMNNKGFQQAKPNEEDIRENKESEQYSVERINIYQQTVYQKDIDEHIRRSRHLKSSRNVIKNELMKNNLKNSYHLQEDVYDIEENGSFIFDLDKNEIRKPTKDETEEDQYQSFFSENVSNIRYTKK